MKISRIELYHVSVPLKATFWPTWIPGYPQTHNRFTLVKLVTDDGIEGYAAGSAMGRERAGLGELMGGYLLGVDPTDIDRVQSLLKQAGYLGWRNYWIEPACWDIIGKAAGKPVYEVLGGEARPVEVYCSTGEMHDPARRVDELLAMRERGFKVAKLRVKNCELKDDIQHIETVAKGVGDKLVLGVDANQGWLVSIVDRVPAWDLPAGDGICRRLPRQRPAVARGAAGLARLRRQRRAQARLARQNLGRRAQLRVGRDKGHVREGLFPRVPAGRHLRGRHRAGQTRHRRMPCA